MATTTEPTPSLYRVANLVYALHSLSILIGVLTVACPSPSICPSVDLGLVYKLRFDGLYVPVTTAIIVGAFVFGLPSIVAVVINYGEAGRAHGTFLGSHFPWLIRTFWFTALWWLIGGVLFATLVGIPIAVPMWYEAGI